VDIYDTSAAQHKTTCTRCAQPLHELDSNATGIDYECSEGHVTNVVRSKVGGDSWIDTYRFFPTGTGKLYEKIKITPHLVPV
jgi:hypothetical protein